MCVRVRVRVVHAIIVALTNAPLCGKFHQDQGPYTACAPFACMLLLACVSLRCAFHALAIAPARIAAVVKMIKLLISLCTFVCVCIYEIRNMYLMEFIYQQLSEVDV